MNKIMKVILKTYWNWISNILKFTQKCISLNYKTLTLFKKPGDRGIFQTEIWQSQVTPAFSNVADISQTF